MKNSEYGFGAKQDHPDERDFRLDDFIAGASDLAAMPEEFSLRNQMTPVKNQGRRSTCNSFSSVALKEFFDSKEEGKTMNFSEEFHYKKIKETDVIDFNYDGAGSFMRSGVKALAEWGVPSEEMLPYDINAPESVWKKTKITKTMENAARPYRAKSYAFVENSVEGFKSALYNTKAPFLMGFKIFKNYGKGKFKGEIPMPGDAEFITGHSVACVGWTKTHFIVKNSWGQNSGDEGYWYIPFEFVGKYTFSCWSITDKINLMNQEKPFPDIPDGYEWSYPAINFWKEKGIVVGFANGMYFEDGMSDESKKNFIRERVIDYKIEKAKK